MPRVHRGASAVVEHPLASQVDDKDAQLVGVPSSHSLKPCPGLCFIDREAAGRDARGCVRVAGQRLIRLPCSRHDSFHLPLWMPMVSRRLCASEGPAPTVTPC
mmetsp:Transcript_1917/g.5392  ORF Transcript_1917/g.5392 Transcript_1917/m.5392 type:complete len:103 (+) Transcript_1917:733-1041(+)